MAFRYGGEEFLVVLPGTSREIGRLNDAPRWRREFASHTIKSSLKGVALSFSAGIALAPQAGTSLAECIKAADVALYRAKISGRNTDIVWGEHLDALGREKPADEERSCGRAPRKQSQGQAVRQRCSKDPAHDAPWWLFHPFLTDFRSLECC
jgi:predicted signal transduction protein with EAL and GGDEF domain